MTYKFLEVEFERPEILFDLKKPIEIYKLFISAVDHDDLRGSNFNKYWDPQHGVYHPHISVRFNLIEEEKVKPEIFRVAQELQNRQEIRYYYPELRPWTEPNFVVKAHETATSCAVRFKEELDTRSDAWSHLTRNPTDFMGHFIVSFLRQSGFNPYVAWSYLRTQPPPYIDEMARSCSQILSQSIGNQKPSSDFVERFVHCFSNCTSLNFEALLRDWLTASMLWRDLAASWRSQQLV